MSITNATALRKNLFGYLDAVAVNDEKIIVTTKNGNAALVSEEYLRNLEETCYLYSIPGMREKLNVLKSIGKKNCNELQNYFYQASKKGLRKNHCKYLQTKSITVTKSSKRNADATALRKTCRPGTCIFSPYKYSTPFSI